MIVESDTDLEVSSRRIVWGKWTNCGQTCIAPDYVLVTEQLKTTLVNEFIQRLKEFYGSEPEKSADYSRIINEKHFECVVETVLALKLYKIFPKYLIRFAVCIFIVVLFAYYFLNVRLLFQ